jgi:hypothetical protein
MAIYNTPSDAANTAVRSFLTKVGEYYLGRTFNTGGGTSKRDWERIRDHVFEGACAYCGTSEEPLQMEHLFMFNREEYGLHHPGNIVPCCKICNKREKVDGKYVNWEKQLQIICERMKCDHLVFVTRLHKIKMHMASEAYPQLSNSERHAIRVIAESLYENIKLESEKSLSMYKNLDAAFVIRDEVQ